MRLVLAFLLGACGTPALDVDAGPPPLLGPWPSGDAHSWNGSFAPQFPLAGLFDDEYFDGHAGADGSPTPILPPGSWDYSDPDNDLANWRNFEANLGTFEALTDAEAQQYGWRFVPNAIPSDYSGAAAYFEGSSGVDELDLGPGGAIHSFASGDLGAGPDVLVFDRAYTLDFRTGADDDLVVAGCSVHADGSFGIDTTTVHTGPGRDWVFVRDLDRAAIDLGNAAGGRTDTIDPQDGHDLIVLRGNTHDFRVFGGAGDDVFVWLVDENVQSAAWLGPSFFGGGGAGQALFTNTGVDRLVLAIPVDAPIVDATPTPNGAVLVRTTSGELILDAPTQGDPFAAYCGECGQSASGERTVILEYNSADGSVRTGYFYLTAVDELQIGVGESARVYRIDATTGTVSEAPDLSPVQAPALPSTYCQ